MSNNGKLQPALMTYEQTYRNELFALNSMEDINKHRSAVMKLSRRHNGGGGDPIITLLTCCIILASPDFISLEEPQKAVDVQTAFAGLLHRLNIPYSVNYSKFNRDIVYF